jgi:hypothetical protein
MIPPGAGHRAGFSEAKGLGVTIGLPRTSRAADSVLS